MLFKTLKCVDLPYKKRKKMLES